jgi:F0F1-type ATP synthase assembly protein I
VDPAKVVVLLLFVGVLMGIGTVVGWLLDRVAESAPLLELFGLAIGIGLGGIVTWSRLSDKADSTGP